MTDIKIYRKNIVRLRGIFLVSAFLAIAAGWYFGSQLSGMESCIIIPKSPFTDGFFEGVIKICLFDIIAFWLLTVPLSDTQAIASSFSVFFFRGLVMGCGCRTFFANSSDAVCILILFSYMLVTLFLIIYDAFLNFTDQKGTLCRILVCFIATGACSILRIFPVLLIK